MKISRRAFYIALALVPVIGLAGFLSRGAVSRPEFKLHPFNLDRTPSTYGVTLKHRASVSLVDGDRSAVYIVWYRLTQTKGGDPENPQPKTRYQAAIVDDGLGELEIYGGYRNQGEKWLAPEYDVAYIGYVKLTK